MDDAMPSNNALSSSPTRQLSSPSARRPSTGDDREKRRGLPTVTPNRFRRFFTPRSTTTGGSRSGSAARRMLHDITRRTNNRSSPVRRGPDGRRVLEPFADIVPGARPAVAADAGPGKKRKVWHAVGPGASRASSPGQENGDGCTWGAPVSSQLEQSGGDDEDEAMAAEVDGEGEEGASDHEPDLVPPVRRCHEDSVGVLRLRRDLGLSTGSRLASTSLAWHDATSHFYSRPSDLHKCWDPTDTELLMPFCIASCHTNSLVAIGDESGGIRLLETAEDSTPPFAQSVLTIQSHHNAVLDLAFSPDDRLLASASGDQMAHVVDMATQQVRCVLAGHSMSLRKIAFQPGSSQIVATSSRDGGVRIWDLRRPSSEAMTVQVWSGHEAVGADPGAAPRGRRSIATLIPKIASISSILNGHSATTTTTATTTTAVSGGRKHSATTTTSTQHDTNSSSHSNNKLVSVTSLAFLPASTGREHLLLTASDANATIKLWDLRFAQHHHRPRRPGSSSPTTSAATGAAVPVSITDPPATHPAHRSYGISSLAVGGGGRDGGRVYSLCRDNRVYAYSTGHLMLGSSDATTPFASSFSSSSSSSSSSSTTATAPASFGLGIGTRSARAWTPRPGRAPLYALRHPRFLASSFYVKLSVRPARADRPELLALGSGLGCALLVPTTTDDDGMHRSSRQRRGSAEPVPCSDHRATPLLHGHSREVTSVSWTRDGALVSVGDDFAARVWRETHRGRASALRRAGVPEVDGVRGEWGWAAECGGDDGGGGGDEEEEGEGEE
ncbi:MAG: hypothetical protein M1826_001737 [Phylliscum demangeonii]|nr:MAG: hypothetical protein M1826_001737 [Phylliscum demangeonii]